MPFARRLTFGRLSGDTACVVQLQHLQHDVILTIPGHVTRQSGTAWEVRM